MIAFGCSITWDPTYVSCAEPGIRRAAEPDSEIIANAAAGSIFRSYNKIMESVADRDDLEALVLVHQDAEIVDEDFCSKVRETLSDPDVGVAGLVGAIDVRSIAWWEASVTWAAFTHRYREFGGGDVESVSWNSHQLPPYARTGEVETLDGFVLVISPWVVRNIRFDESLGVLHGYDLDFCLQVREAGKRVVTMDAKAIHHHSLDLVLYPEMWMEAHQKVAEKWQDRMPGIGLPPAGIPAGDWKARARRAEAELGLTRLIWMSVKLQKEARERELLAELETVKESVSWKVTEPVRRVMGAVRARRNGIAMPKRVLAQRAARGLHDQAKAPTDGAPSAGAKHGVAARGAAPHGAPPHAAGGSGAAPSEPAASEPIPRARSSA